MLLIGSRIQEYRKKSRAESGGICGKDGSQQTGCVQVGEG